jgi:electron transport complex protein RnfE
MLGMCPTLAVSTAAINGLGMGFSTMAVLVLSNLIISLLRKVIPDEVRLPSYIVVVASLVTVTELLIKAYLPSIYSALGLFIPLIVVNCIIFARAESFAFKNPPLPSIADGLGMGLGFTWAITFISSVREIFGAGTWFGIEIPVIKDHVIGIMTMSPGGFFVFGVLMAGATWLTSRPKKAAAVEEGGNA